MNGIIRMLNTHIKEREASAVKKKQGKAQKTKSPEKTKEDILSKQMAKSRRQLNIQNDFHRAVTESGLILAKLVFEKEDATADERAAAIRLLAELTSIAGMPRLAYPLTEWKIAFKGHDAFYQFDYVYYSIARDGLNGIADKGYVVETSVEKLKEDSHFLRFKHVNKSGTKKGRYVRTVYILIPALLENDELWNNFRKRVVFNTDPLGQIKTVSFNEAEIDLPVLSPIGADFDGDKLYPAVYDEAPANTESEDQAVNATDDNGLFNKMNETISYLNSLSELEGWSAWHGTEYRRTGSKGHIYAVIAPDKLSGVGTATWYELFDPGYEKPKYVDLVKRHIEAVLRDKYDYTISYPTKTEIEDEIFEADAHAWIDHPDTEKCGFAYTKHGNVTHLPENMKLAIFPKNMKLAIFPMITITEKSDNT